MRRGVCVCVWCRVSWLVSGSSPTAENQRHGSVEERDDNDNTDKGRSTAAGRERDTHARDDGMEIATASSRTGAGSLIWQMSIREPSRFPIAGGLDRYPHPHPVPITAITFQQHASHHSTAQHSIKAPGGLESRRTRTEAVNLLTP